jgi:DNA-binding SARP family transcriptional activator
MSGTGARLVLRAQAAEVAADATARHEDAPALRIHLIGQMRATNRRGDSVLPKSRHSRAVLAALCLAEGERVPRTRLYGQLWDRVDEEQARASFRQALYKLTIALGGEAETLIEIEREFVRLDHERCWIDVPSILDDVSTLTESPVTPDGASRLLEGLDGISASFDQWLMGERARFADELRERLEASLRALIEADAAPAEIARAARRFVAADPTNEFASQALMRSLAEQGNRAHALREYERCRNTLRRMLDVAPSRETANLYEAIKAASTENPGGLSLSPRATFAPRPRRVEVRAFASLSREVDPSMPGAFARQLAAALARFGWFEAYSFEDRTAAAPSEPDAPRPRAADYVVDGTLSIAGGALAVDAQLIDVIGEARPIWVEKFRVALDSLGDLNDRIAAQISARVDTTLLLAEGRRAAARDGADAVSLWLRAIPLLYSMEREKYEEAGRLLERAREADPENPVILAWSAFWHVFYVGQGWTSATVAAFEIAEGLCIQAIRIDPDNAEAVGIYAHVNSYLSKDFENGLHYFERSLRLNPSLAFVWALSAATYCYLGQPREARWRLERFRELSPFDVSFSVLESISALAHVLEGDYAQAVVVGRRVVAANPTFVNGYAHLLTALGHLGRKGEAAPYLQRLRAIKPNFSVAHFVESYPFRRAQDRLRYAEGLTKAGLPGS